MDGHATLLGETELGSRIILNTMLHIDGPFQVVRVGMQGKMHV